MKAEYIKKDKPIKITKAYKDKRTQEAIKLLNVIVALKLAPSPIHGVGLFAIRDINRNVRLNADAIPHAFNVPYKKFKELRPEVSELLLSHWPRIVNDKPFLYPYGKMSSYINHSDTPNYDATTDKTTSKVKAGEEITQNYRLVDNWQKLYPWLDLK